MLKSKSNREALMLDLQVVAVKHQATPSTLLSKFEDFLAREGVTTHQQTVAFKRKLESNPYFKGWNY